jgi:hypothetical protein
VNKVVYTDKDIFCWASSALTLVVIAVEEPVEVLQQILFVFDAVRHAAPHPAQITPRVNSHDGVAYPGDHVGHASQGLLTFANNNSVS